MGDSQQGTKNDLVFAVDWKKACHLVVEATDMANSRILDTAELGHSDGQGSLNFCFEGALKAYLI